MHLGHSRFAAAHCALALLALGGLTRPSELVGQQQAIPIRRLAPTIATSIEPVSDVSSIRALDDGRVLVNDPRRRSVLLFDSTLQHALVVADTTSATANAYGAGLIGLTRFTGDSSLLEDQTTGAFVVMSADGRVARIIAAPGNARPLVGLPGNTPRFFDQTSHLVFAAPPTIFLSLLAREFVGDTLMRGPDSSAILRRDIVTRRIDTIAMLKAPRIRQAVTRRVNGGSGRAAFNPIPSSDDWTVLNDGTLAVIRVSDYHVDWIRPDGRMTSSPAIPTPSARLTDSMKVAIIDSVRANDLRAGIGRDDAALPLAQRRVYVEPADLPDYKPPFISGFARSDARGNVWVRANTPADAAVVYEVINRNGVVIDRVEIPAGTTILGFGPGAVYLLSRTSAGTRLSKAVLQ